MGDTEQSDGQTDGQTDRVGCLMRPPRESRIIAAMGRHTCLVLTLLLHLVYVNSVELSFFLHFVHLSVVLYARLTRSVNPTYLLTYFKMLNCFVHCRTF